MKQAVIYKELIRNLILIYSKNSILLYKLSQLQISSN